MDNQLNINIDTGEKSVTINNDPARVIVFNPTDVLFAERFYALLGELKQKLHEYSELGAALSIKSKLDSDGTPDNMMEQIRLQVETCEYLSRKIDALFGDGTSRTVFGETRNFAVFKQFFDGLLPLFEATRVEKVAMYTSPASAKRNKRRR